MAEDQLPGLTGNALAPLSIQGMSVDSLNDLMGKNPGTFDMAQETSGGNHFWSCWPRRYDDRTRDVLDLGLGATKIVNRIRFQVSQFPCTITVEYQDPADLLWKPTQDSQTRKAVVVPVVNSVPPVIKSGVTDANTLHPQHTGAGHWLPVEVKIRPVVATRVRLVLSRNATVFNVPRDFRAEPVAYSLAVRDFEVGYEVAERADFEGIAQTGQDAARLEAIATAADLLGSQTAFVVRETRATHVLEALREQAEVEPEDRVGTNYVWKSEPQPISDAVVNFYLDLRDENGASTVLDRLFLDPITSGVTMRIYHSEHVPDSTGGISEATEFLSPSMASVGDSNPGIDEQGVFFGTDAPAFLDIDNTVLQWDRRRPWWFGLEMQPQFVSDDPGTWHILDTREVKVWWTDEMLNVRVFNETTVFPETTFIPNQQVKILVGWDSRNVTIQLPNQGVHYTASGSDMFTDQTKTLRFGGQNSDLGADPGRGNYRLTGFFLKQVTPNEEESADFFQSQGDFYQAWADDSRTRHSILRIHPTLRRLALDSSPYGVIGGSPLGFYEAVRWKPVNRNFRLERGFIEINPIRARYLKFEFTDLAAQPYVAPRPTTLWVKQYPNVVRSSASKLPGGTQTGIEGRDLAGIGGTVNQDLAKVKSFLDQNGLVAARQKEYEDYTPTEGLYSPDTEVQERLKALNPLFGLIPWSQGGTDATGSNLDEVHIYTNTLVRAENKVAFFVGLKAVRIYQADYTVADDSGAYLYDFYNARNLGVAASSWTFEAPEYQGLTLRPDWVGSTATQTSAVLFSKQKVRGLQFATVQSPARQRLTDPEFTDPTLFRWDAYEGAQISISGDFNADLGSLLKVQRKPDGAYWEYLELDGTWDDIEDSMPGSLHPTWDEFSADPAIGAPSGGVVGTETIDLPTRGRVYAAARVYAPTPLSAPLHIQVIGHEGEVLADEKTVDNPHQVIEWYATYTIGETGVDETALLWDDIEAIGDWSDVEDEGTWSDVATGGGGFASYDSQVVVRLYQEGVSDDTFYVDSIAVYEDPIVWEFSNDSGNNWYPAYDIRNDPYGGFLFPDADEEFENRFAWRLVGARPDLHVSSLLVRPWYSAMPMGVPSNEPLNHGGPHDNFYDQYPMVIDSPHFKAWSRPVPEDWWASFRRAAPIRAMPPLPPTIPTHLRIAEAPPAPVLFLVEEGP